MLPVSIAPCHVPSTLETDQSSAALLPEAPDHFVVGQNFSLKLRVHGGQLEPQRVFASRHLRSFHSVDRLVQAVHRRVPLAMRIL